MESGSTVDKYTSVLVAQYLKKSGYYDTLKSFLREAALPLTVADPNTEKEDEAHLDDLESIIKERIEFSDNLFEDKLKNLTINNELPPMDQERFSLKNYDFSMKFKTPICQLFEGLPIGCKFSEIDDEKDKLVISLSNRDVSVYDDKLVAQNLFINGDGKPLGIVKLCGGIKGSGLYYACFMDGSISFFDKNSVLVTGGSFKLHRRMISNIQISQKNTNSWYIISTGLDNILKLNTLTVTNGIPQINESSSISLMSTCTALQSGNYETCVNDEVKNTQVIFLSRLDFTHIMCFKIDGSSILQPWCNIALNNAQFSTHSFNIRDLTLVDFKTKVNDNLIGSSTMIAVSTSHMPYMRLILVEIPSLTEGIQQTSNSSIQTYYDKILRNIATQVPQDSFSQPLIRFLPKANGLIVGADEAIYAIDVERAESWVLDLLDYPQGERVKTMDVDKLTSKIIVGLANKSVYMWSP